MTTQGPRAVVTGATGGIGRAIAARLLAAGCAVTLAGRDPGRLDALAANLTGSVDVLAFDVTLEHEVDQALGSRHVDILVNNAGAASAAPLGRTTLAEWECLHRVNATGPFLCSRAVLQGMRERDFGRIVTVASTAAIIGAPYTAAYTASKHAILGMTRAVAAEVAGSGVTVNAVCPAFVDTPMTDRTVHDIMQATGRSEPEARAALTQATPLGRLVRPDEVAAAVAWLATDNTGAVNGQTLVLDGGAIQG